MALQRDFVEFETRGYKARVRLGTIAPLEAYSSDGQTLTRTGFGPLPNIDGLPVAVGDHILYFSGFGSLAPDNGVYTVIDLGSGGTSWQLKRRAGFTTSSQLASMAQIAITEGGLAGTIFTLRSSEPIVLNTDDLTFEPIEGGGIGVVELVPSGEIFQVPANHKMLHHDDLELGEIDTSNIWDGTGGSDTGATWARTGQGSESTASAFSGTNGLDTGSTSGSTLSRFNNGSEIDVDGTYLSVSFQLQPKLYPVNANLTIQFQNAGEVLVGDELNVEDYVDMTLDNWQRVFIPINQFNLTADVQHLVLTYADVGAQQHWIDLLELQEVADSELNIEGSLEQIDTVRNFSENVVPIRTTRTIPSNEQMLFSGGMRVDGTLQINGKLTDVTPSDADQLLATLGEVVSLDEFLIGGGSPMKAVGATEARAALDVLSATESTDLIVPFGMTIDAAVKTSSFEAEVGKIHLLLNHGIGAANITFPTANDGDIIGFWGVGSVNPSSEKWTLSGLVESAIQSCSTIPFKPRGELLFIRYYAANNSWKTSGGATNYESLPHIVLATEFQGNLKRVGLGENEVLGRNDLLNGSIKGLTSAEQRHTLFAVDDYITGTDVGTQIDYTPVSQLSWFRAAMFDWAGASAVNIGGFEADQTASDFNHWKVIRNGSGSAADMGFYHECTSTTAAYRIRTPKASAGSAGRFFLAPGESVLLWYSESSASSIGRWVIVGSETPASKLAGVADSFLYSDSSGVYTAGGRASVQHILQGTSDNGAQSNTTSSGTVNDWVPVGTINWYPCHTLRWGETTVTADITVTGFITDNIPGVTFVYEKTIINESSTYSMFFQHLTGSATDQQIRCPGGVTYEIPPGGSAKIIYDPDMGSGGLWQIIGPNDPAGALGVTSFLNGQVTTPAAAATTIASYVTQTDDTTQRFKFTVTALDIATDDSAYWDASALFHRSNTASTVTEKDITFLNGPFKDAGAAAWTVTMTIVSQTINIVVTAVGEATPTKWKITGTVVED